MFARFRIYSPWILLSAILLSLLIFRFFILDHKLSLLLAQHTIYWVTFLLFFLYLLLGISIFRRLPWKNWGQRNIIGLLLCFMLAAYFQVKDAHQHKIIYDEYCLSNTAKLMHEKRLFLYPVGAHYYQEKLNYTKGLVDKRAPLFPFLVSLIHDIKGYSINNSYLINAIFSFIFLLLLYQVGVIFLSKQLGYFLVITFSSLPLFSQNATGAGYDLFNLCMLLGLYHTGYFYLQQPNNKNLLFFILHACLLANTRYESVLYLYIVGACFIFKCIQNKNYQISWWIPWTPLALWSTLLLNYIYVHTPEFFELQKDQTSAFGLEYLLPNLEHAIYYLLNPTSTTSNSLLLSILGILSLVSNLVALPKYIRNKSILNSNNFLYYSFFVPISLSFGMLMFLFWGHWDDPMASRFSFSLQLYFVFSIAKIASDYPSFFHKYYNYFICIATFYFAAFTITKLNLKDYEDAMLSHKLLNVSLAAIQKYVSSKDLIICYNALPHISLGYPTIPTKVANHNPMLLKLALERNFYKNIFFVDYNFIGNKSNFNSYTPDWTTPISSVFITEEVFSSKATLHTIVRLHRLIDIKIPDELQQRRQYSDFPYASPEEMMDKFVEELP